MKVRVALYSSFPSPPPPLPARPTTGSELRVAKSHRQANPLALVDCVQDTYSNVAALIDDSVYNMEGGMEEDLEKMMMDLTRVDNRVTTIVAGVRSMSMTFKARLPMVVTTVRLVIHVGDFGRFSHV